MKPVDLSGQTFGRLAVIRFIESRPLGKSKVRIYACRCECGTQIEALAGNLTSGHTQSCGCLQRGRAAQSATTHGLGSRPEFNCWSKMRQRCTNPKNKDYPNYGGRGIRVCERWNDFALFLSDMGSRPSSLHSIERIDNSGDYAPGNCRWATRQEQNSNTRVNRFITFNGETRTVTAWARVIGIPPSVLHKRTFRGWSDLRVIKELSGVA